MKSDIVKRRVSDEVLCKIYNDLLYAYINFSLHDFDKPLTVSITHSNLDIHFSVYRVDDTLNVFRVSYIDGEGTSNIVKIDLDKKI